MKDILFLSSCVLIQDRVYINNKTFVKTPIYTNTITLTGTKGDY